MAKSPQETLGTILVVDDNEGVLNMVVTVLENANFNVLSASSASDAVQLAAQTQDPIDLLLSDIEMPAMSGLDLGQLLTSTRHDLHVMLMSGGNYEGFQNLGEGWEYIQKPFVPGKLVQKVNEALHAGVLR